MFCCDVEMEIEVFPGSHTKMRRLIESHGVFKEPSFKTRTIIPETVHVNPGDIFVILQLTLFKIRTRCPERPITCVIAYSTRVPKQDFESFPALYPSAIGHQSVITNSIARELVEVQFAFRGLEFGAVAFADSDETSRETQKRDCSCFLHQSSLRDSSTSAMVFNELRDNIFGKMSSHVRLLTCWQQERCLNIVRRNRRNLPTWLQDPNSIRSPDFEIIAYLHACVGEFVNTKVEDQIQSFRDLFGGSLPAGFADLYRRNLLPEVDVDLVTFQNVSGNTFTTSAKEALKKHSLDIPPCSTHSELVCLVMDKKDNVLLLASKKITRGSIIMELLGLISTDNKGSASVELSTQSLFFSCHETHGNSSRFLMKDKMTNKDSKMTNKDSKIYNCLVELTLNAQGWPELTLIALRDLAVWEPLTVEWPLSLACRGVEGEEGEEGEDEEDEEEEEDDIVSTHGNITTTDIAVASDESFVSDPPTSALDDESKMDEDCPATHRNITTTDIAVALEGDKCGFNYFSGHDEHESFSIALLLTKPLHKVKFLINLLQSVYQLPDQVGRLEALVAGLRASKLRIFNLILEMPIDDIERNYNSIKPDGGCLFRLISAGIEISKKIKSAEGNYNESRVLGFDMNLNVEEDRTKFLENMEFYMSQLSKLSKLTQVDYIGTELSKCQNFVQWVTDKFPYEGSKAPTYPRTAQGVSLWGDFCTFQRDCEEDLHPDGESLNLIVFTTWANFFIRSNEAKLCIEDEEKFVFGNPVCFDDLKADIVSFYDGSHFYLFEPNLQIPIAELKISKAVCLLAESILRFMEINLDPDRLQILYERKKAAKCEVPIKKQPDILLAEECRFGSYFQFQLAFGDKFLQGTICRDLGKFVLLDSCQFSTVAFVNATPFVEDLSSDSASSVVSFLAYLRHDITEKYKEKEFPSTNSLSNIYGKDVVQLVEVEDLFTAIQPDQVIVMKSLMKSCCEPCRQDGLRALPLYGRKVCSICRESNRPEDLYYQCQDCGVEFCGNHFSTPPSRCPR